MRILLSLYVPRLLWIKPTLTHTLTHSLTSSLFTLHVFLFHYAPCARKLWFVLKSNLNICSVFFVLIRFIFCVCKNGISRLFIVNHFQEVRDLDDNIVHKKRERKKTKETNKNRGKWFFFHVFPCVLLLFCYLFVLFSILVHCE